MALFGSGKNQRQDVQYEQRRSSSRQQQRYQNDRELKEQRIKSRNRLVGSVILVLAAIIILPLILKTGDNDSGSTESTAPLIQPGSTIGQSGGLVVESSPGVQTPTDPQLATQETETAEQAPAASSGTESTDNDMPLAVAGALDQREGSPTSGTGDGTSSGVSIAESTANQSASQEAAARERAEQAAAERERAQQARAEQQKQQQQKQQEQAKQQGQAKQQQKPKNQIDDKKRTDDGSKALAILEGRTPPAKSSAPTAANSGEFSLQVASYSSANDARVQRDRLRGSGVSNAYVQSATVNGKQVYRLRVGPFSTKEAAQAAQTRLRALNFSDSFVTGR